MIIVVWLKGCLGMRVEPVEKFARTLCRLVEKKEDGVPNIKKICHDSDKDLDAMYKAYLAGGDTVADIDDRN